VCDLFLLLQSLHYSPAFPPPYVPRICRRIRGHQRTPPPEVRPPLGSNLNLSLSVWALCVLLQPGGAVYGAFGAQYIYIYIYTHIYIYIYIYINIYIYIYIYIQTHIQIYIYSIDIYGHIYIYILCRHTHTHYIHIYTYLYVRCACVRRDPPPHIFLCIPPNIHTLTVYTS